MDIQDVHPNTAKMSRIMITMAEAAISFYRHKIAQWEEVIRTCSAAGEADALPRDAAGAEHATALRVAGIVDEEAFVKGEFGDTPGTAEKPHPALAAIRKIGAGGG
jgi:hypothetical protein